MKQLLILSGKGGTGKTTVASAFIALSEARAYADCDVDAPNLHLITKHPEAPTKKNYYGMPKAEIDPGVCINCGKCRDTCRFDAIDVNERTHFVDPFACEGCGVCEFVCPADAVSLHPSVAGDLMLFKDGPVIFSTAQLKMGSGTTGMLVSEVKKQMKDAAGDAVLAVIDGSPGIGCPVIASISGTDMVLIVAEPSLSGFSDLERIVKTARIFGVKLAVCVNKSDTNKEKTERIKDFCLSEGITYTGSIPFDPMAVVAVNAGMSIAEIDCPSGKAVRRVFNETMRMILEEGSADPNDSNGSF